MLSHKQIKLRSTAQRIIRMWNWLHAEMVTGGTVFWSFVHVEFSHLFADILLNSGVTCDVSQADKWKRTTTWLKWQIYLSSNIVAENWDNVVQNLLLFDIFYDSTLSFQPHGHPGRKWKTALPKSSVQTNPVSRISQPV